MKLYSPAANAEDVHRSRRKVQIAGRLRAFEWGLRRTWSRIRQDDCLGLAAQIAFFFVLSLFPFLIVLGAIAGLLRVSEIWGDLSSLILRSFPSDSRPFVLHTLSSFSHGSRAFLSLGFLGTLWAATTGVVSLMETLSRAYDVKETRGFWRKRLVALGVVISTSLFFLGSFGFLTLGHKFSHFLGATLHLGTAFDTVWAITRWCAAFILLATGIAIIDNVLPNRRRRWRWITAGSIFETAMLILGTWGVNLYVRYVAHYNQTYGALGAFFVMMLWIYIASFILLVGAETNSAFEKLQVLKSPK